MLGYESFIESGAPEPQQHKEPAASNGPVKGDTIDASLTVKAHEPPRPPTPKTEQQLLEEAIARMDAEEGRSSRRRTRAH